MEEKELIEMISKESNHVIMHCKDLIGIQNPDYNEVFSKVYYDLALDPHRQFSNPKQICPKYMLPFFDQLIYNLSPMSESDFKKYIDIEIDDIVRLVKENRLILNLEGSYINYKSLDYLDPVLELNPPSNSREMLLVNFLLNGKIKDFIVESNKIFDNNITPNTGWKNDYIRNVFNRTYFEMAAIGELNTLHEMIEKGQYLGIFTGSSILIGPFLWGLGGAPNYEKSHIDIYEDMSGIKGEKIFPIEIGKFLTEKYDLFFPLHTKLDDVEKIYCENVMDSARTLLYSFYDDIKQENPSAIDKVEDIENKFNEIRELMLQIEPLSKKYNKWIGCGISLGSFGLSLITANPAIGISGLLAGLGFTVTGSHITEEIAKWKMGSLPSNIWEFERKIRDISEIKMKG